MKRFNISSYANTAVGRLKFVPVFLLVFLTLSFTTATQADELIVNGGFEAPALATFPDGAGTRARPYAGTTPFVPPDSPDDPGRGWTTFYGENQTGDCLGETYDVFCHGNTLLPGWDVWWTNTLKSPLGDDTYQPGRVEIQHDAFAAYRNDWIDYLNTFIPDPADQIRHISNAWEGVQKAELDSHDRYDLETGVIADDTNVSINQTLLTCPGQEYVLTYAWRARTTIPSDNDVRVVIWNNTEDTAPSVVRTHMESSAWVEEEIKFVSARGDDGWETAIGFISIGGPNTKGMSLDSVSVTGPTPDADGYCPSPCPECTTDLTADTNSDGLHDETDHENGAISCNCLADDGSSDDGADGSSDDFSGYGRSDCGLCADGGGFSTLTLLYDGDDYSTSGSADASVDPLVVVPPLPVSATITVTHDDTGLALWPGGMVLIGTTFEIAMPDASELTGFITIEIKDGADVLQTIRFDTACDGTDDGSSDDFVGMDLLDSFGGITIWDAVKY